MKSAVLCSLVILTIICHLSFSVSVMGNEMKYPADQLTKSEMDESNLLTTLLRTKRQSHLSICRYCCNCCKNKGCGLCCRT
ncbi:hepcidin-2 [Bombina bombina]|uniref:hepcidin-2 n=1 Tax=Bombina bombina TaxID=8345 RepID=UPI00235A72D5|nr:hepcidin-2 [Bombina bombina]